MRRAKSKRNTGRRRKQAWPWIAAGTVFLVLGLLAVALYSERRQARLASEAPAAAPTSTTTWPFGQPEYVVEVPKGYEDLLPAESGSQETPPPAPAKKEAPRVAKRAEPFVRTRLRTGTSQPTLIIVIDDVGYNLAQLDPFLALPFPLTTAVLPGVDHSAESAKMAKDAGKEVILHQPMEALGGNNPGPGAITLKMGPEEASQILAANLDSLPQVVGVNNHMGSAVTRDKALMEAVLSLVKARGIYYLDSLTTSGTATAEVCAELTLPLWERDVFLDNSGDRQSILRSLEEGKKIASSKGAAVLIGHVWSAELAQTLMDIYPRLVEEGYSLSTISKFMLSSTEEDDDARPGD